MVLIRAAMVLFSLLCAPDALASNGVFENLEHLSQHISWALHPVAVLLAIGFYLAFSVSAIGTVGLRRQLKQRIKAEESLKLLYNAVEQSSEGMAVSDLKGNLLFVNHAFASMHGYTSEELKGRSISFLHSEEQMPEVEEANRRLLKYGIFAGEIWHRRRDGGLFPTFMHNSMLRADDGRFMGMIATLRDITEQKSAQKALLESEARYRLLVDSIPLHIGVIDKSGKYTLWNSFSESMFGYTPEEVVGLLSPLDMHESSEDAADVLKTAEEKGVFSRELNLVHKDGHTFPALLVVVPSRSPSGETEHYYGFAIDITKRRRAEEQLKAYSERLEHMVEERTRELDRVRADLFMSAKLAAMGRMGAGIAHQLNSPICGGLLIIDSLLEQTDVDAELERKLKVLRSSLEGMRDVIDCMLSMAMIGRRGSSQVQEIDLNDMIQKILAFMGLEVQKHKIQVSSSFAEGLPSIRARIGELDQIFLNLMNNAIDSMEAGGRLSVSTEPDGDGVKVRVEDTGRGIEPEYKHRIFEPFFTTNSGKKGLGLGLSIVRDIVASYGGTIDVESWPGKGSRFTVTLPRRKA